MRVLCVYMQVYYQGLVQCVSTQWCLHVAHIHINCGLWPQLPALCRAVQHLSSLKTFTDTVEHPANLLLFSWGWDADTAQALAPCLGAVAPERVCVSHSRSPKETELRALASLGPRVGRLQVQGGSLDNDDTFIKQYSNFMFKFISLLPAGE